TKEQKQLQQEQDFIFDKNYTCPVCDKEFKNKTVKVGKAKLAGTDLDLRPRYEGIDLLKYDIVLCPRCGYAALTRYFKSVSAFQSKKIKETISASFKEKKETSEIYSYEDALERYKLTLANAIVKQGKSSEKAYICLKSAWLLRGWQESLEEEDPQKAELAEEEQEYLKNALEGFVSARQSEGYPMCGMDEETVDYMIAVLAMGCSKLDVASKMVASLLTKNGGNPRMKEKARDLKEILMDRIKQKK
ncbi:MAG: DUF2225 domain-containing protein, partial [Lachnospiraceae bacterium]